MHKILLKMAWRNMWRNKHRTLISVSSVYFAALFCILMKSYSSGSLNYIVDSFIERETGTFKVMGVEYWDDKMVDNFIELDDSTLSKYEEVDGVLRIAPRIESFAMGWNGIKTRPLLLIGISPEREIPFSKLNGRMESGTFLSQNDDGIIVGSRCAEILGLAVGDSLALMGQGYHGASAAELFVVRGIVKCYDPLQDASTVYKSLTAAQEFISMPNGVSSVAVLLKDEDTRESVINEFKVINGDKTLEYRYWKDLIKNTSIGAAEDEKSMEIYHSFLYVIVFFGLLSTVIMLTNERTKEFGVMAALGTKRSVLMGGLFLELFMISLLGILVSIAISLPIVAYFHFNPIECTGAMKEILEEYGVEAVLPFALSARIFIEQIIIVGIMSVLVMVYPFGKIRKMKIIDALRIS